MLCTWAVKVGDEIEKGSVIWEWLLGPKLVWSLGKDAGRGLYDQYGRTSMAAARHTCMAYSISLHHRQMGSHRNKWQNHFDTEPHRLATAFFNGSGRQGDKYQFWACIPIPIGIYVRYGNRSRWEAFYSTRILPRAILSVFMKFQIEKKNYLPIPLEGIYLMFFA